MHIRFSHKLALATLLAAAPSFQAQTANHPAPATPDNDTMLARAGALYYSAVRPEAAHGRLEHFQCSVQPEWPTLLAAIDKATGHGSGAPTPNDPRLALLTPITITENVDVDGHSTLEWNQPAVTAQSADAAASEMLDHAHQTVEHALEGFFQFWTPFMNGTIIPATSNGIEITHTDAGYVVHAELSDQKLNEVFSNDWRLKEFNVSMSGVAIRFMPTFDSTSEGLLVKAFDARIQLPGATSAPERQMQVALDYQTVQGFELPSHLALDVSGIGRASFVFSGCTVQAASKQ